MRAEGPSAAVALDKASAVLFDLDGTLIETHIDFPLMKREMLAVAADHGLDTAALQNLDILSIVEAARGLVAATDGPDAGEALRLRCHGILREIEVEQCARPDRVQGAAEVVARLHGAGVPVGIVTRNSREVSRSLLAFAGIDVAVIVAREDVSVTKPDPRHVLVALDALAVPADRRSLAAMVGDHAMDIEAGHAAGVQTIGVLNGRDSGVFERCTPDLILARTADLLSLLPQRRHVRP